MVAKSQALIRWKQVWALALMQGAIALTWVIYNLYLVQLLTRLGFPQSLAVGLLLLENLLAMLMEPLMGTFSDQRQQQVGTRFPLISLGAILAAGCFVIIPTVVIWGQSAGWRWALPIMLVAWALAMTVFRSPALSLLGRYAIGTQLPQAASILTLVGGLAGAMGPLANQFILSLGSMITFAVGSGVLLLATVVLRWVGPDVIVLTSDADACDEEPVPTEHLTTPLRELPWRDLGLVFGAGAGIVLGFRLIMTFFPVVLRAQVPNIAPGLILGAIFIALAVAAFPAGALAVRLGNRRAMVLGLAAMALVAALMVTIRSSGMGFGLAILFGAAFSLVSNGTIPFALSMVPPDKAGLGTGIYFSGGAFAASLFGSLMGSDSAAPSWSALLGAFAFLLAGICISSTRGDRPSSPIPSTVPSSDQ